MSNLPSERPGAADLVVVGSSAGGIEALSILVSALPTDFPVPIVLAQHLDPHRTSQLSAILTRRSSLPIVTVAGQTQLEPGTIYVVPANRHVRISDGIVNLEEDFQDRPRPSVDLLLTSAAEAYGERLIALILTGSGSDGAAGAVEVKNAGGIVIIQNPQTARYPSMPMALPPTGVDHVVDLEQIGPLLYDIVKGVSLPAQREKTEDALRDILLHVGHQANIDFSTYKSSTILRRIARRMAVTRNPTLRDYEQYLRLHPEEIGKLAMSFLITVTEFFRDPEAFQYLRDHVLPQAIERGRVQGRVLRCWSAGCATGEEPYSLALLLADLLGAELPEWSIKIFATDIDESAIAFARRGLYPRNVLQNLPHEYLTRFFEPIEPGYRVAKALRQMVIFGQQDLTRGAPFPRIDLVICRNLLIYFKPELQHHILDVFAYSLQQVNGYLFLGKAETARPSRATFELVDKRWKIYRCTSGPIPAIDRVGVSDTRALQVERPSPARSIEKPLPGETVHIRFDISQLRAFNEQLLRFLPTGMAIIDRSYRVIAMNAAARRALGIHDTANDQDFLHIARGLPYTQAREAIDAAFRDRVTTTLIEIALDPVTGSSARSLNLTITPLPFESGERETALVSLLDVTEQMQFRRRLETAQAEQKQLLEELSAANRRLNDLNKELQDTNEELQATNEELTLAQEELQATNEEFETTNEELQAANEELETNNEELQATNEELETTNEELRARTAELQELARMLENDHRRMAEVVELAPFHIMVLRGPNLTVEVFNPRYARQFKGQQVQGRPLIEVLDLFWKDGDAILQLTNRAYHEDTVVYTTQPLLTYALDEQGQPTERYFVYTLVPTHENEQVNGVAVYALDVTRQRT